MIGAGFVERERDALVRVDGGSRRPAIAQHDMRRYAKDHQDFALTAELLSAAMERGLSRSIRI